MATPTGDPFETARRLEALERENRRLRRGGKALVALFGAAILVAAAPAGPRKVVEAERFVVRDAAGKVRAALGIREDGSPSLNLYDQDAKTRAVLGLEGGDPVLGLLDQAGHGRVQVAFEESGASRVTLFDERETGRAQLALEPDGSPSLAFADRERKASAWMSVDRDGAPALSLQDRAGKSVFKVP